MVIKEVLGDLSPLPLISMEKESGAEWIVSKQEQAKRGAQLQSTFSRTLMERLLSSLTRLLDLDSEPLALLMALSVPIRFQPSSLRLQLSSLLELFTFLCDYIVTNYYLKY
tara:strand:+ start:865 stop:1197 length:333 start_codon:yes stop_codon:yes gene_type:complete